MPSLDSSEGYRWEPDEAPMGPVSMVLSGYDKRIIVLRNGVEIGRSTITLQDPETPLGTHAFVMARRKAGVSLSDAGDSRSLRWIGVGITGHMDDTNRPPDPGAKNRVRIPDAFLHVLNPTLGAGSTLLITDEPVLESTTGMSLAVLSSSPEDSNKAPKK